MAIPIMMRGGRSTTILVDARGIVRWIDQTTDYMQRSDPERVIPVIRAALAG